LGLGDVISGFSSLKVGQGHNILRNHHFDVI